MNLKKHRGFSLLFTLFGILIVTLILGSSFILASTSERISSNSDTFSQATNLSEYAAVMVMQDQDTINSVVNKAMDKGPSTNTDPLPLKLPQGFDAKGSAKMWVQKLPLPINSPPGIINAYVIKVDVDLTSNDVARKKPKVFYVLVQPIRATIK